MARGYTSTHLSSNRRAVIASASVTREKNAIHGFTEIDIAEARSLIREHRDKTGERLSFTAYIVACLAKVLRQYPQFNAFIRGNRLIVLDDITISVLVEREIKGEKVPEPVGIREAQNKTYRQIHSEIREAQKQTGDVLGGLSGMTWFRFIPRFLLKAFVRIADKSIRMGMAYGKIGVTAVGMYSKDPIWFIPHGTPTVLLSVGSIVQRVVEVDGSFVSREHLCLTASFDHDIIDGAPAARFMGQLIEDIKSGYLVRETLDDPPGSTDDPADV